MSNLFRHDKYSTPLTDEEKQGLKQKWVTTREELNSLETLGIFNAEKKLVKTRNVILSENFLKKLHKQIFGSIWDWAGKYRTTERNIGIPPYQISSQLKILFDDVNYWIKHHTYPPKEIAIRLHHRLVHIHPFANGNGRTSRLLADLLMEKTFNQPKLNWGNKCIDKLPEHRSKYMTALRKADRGDYSALIQFLDESNCNME